MRDIKLDAVKGILILLIVLEHNFLLASTVFWVRPVTDSFVAGAFLILSFSRNVKDLSFFSYVDKYCSYMVPFLVFMTFFTLIHILLFGGETVYERVFNYALAFFLQSPFYIKASSGFSYLWFLPCLCFLFLLRYFHKKTNNIFVVVMAIATLLIGFLPEDTLYRFPFSAHVAFFIYAIGWLYGKCHERLIGFDLYGIGSAVIFILLLVVGYDLPHDLLLFAGVIPSFVEPVFYYYLLILFFANPGIYCLMRVVPKLLLNLFAYLGRNSIAIYVSHQVFYVGLTRFLGVDDSGLVVYGLTVMLSIVFAFLMRRLEGLNRIVFPETVSSSARLLFRIKSSV